MYPTNQRTPEKSYVGRNFLFYWILANGVGVGLGVTAGWVLAGVTLSLVTRGVLWAVIGFVGGFTQLWVLRQQIHLSRWVWMSVAGWTVGGFLAGRENVDWALFGAVIGLCQWLVLKEYLNQAGWWILANATGLVFGGFIGGSVILLEDFLSFKTETVLFNAWGNEIVGWIISGLVGGATNGLITGLWLVWLLNSNLKARG